MISLPPINREPLVYSANQGLPVKAAEAAPAARAWGAAYGDRVLNYEADFASDAAVYGGRLGQNKPATVVAMAVRDPKTKKGLIGLLNDSSEGTTEGNHFKTEFVKRLRNLFERANINAAVYENKVNFVLVIEGEIDQRYLADLCRKALADMNPYVEVREHGVLKSKNIFEGRARPEPMFGWTRVTQSCPNGELKVIADRLIKIVKHEKRYGLVDFKSLLESIKAPSTAGAESVKLIDPDWKLVNENWGKYEEVFYHCIEKLPDDYEAELSRILPDDPQTRAYLLGKNRQLYFEGASGAYNREAFLRIVSNHLAKRADNIFIGAGDIYNVGGMNPTIGPTLTDRYLKIFFDSWKEIGDQFGVKVRIFRMGGDEFAVEFRGANADQVAEMTRAFDKLVNSKKVLTPEVLKRIPANETKILLKAGLIRRLANGDHEVVETTFGQIARKYAKIKGVVTKGSQFSLYIERIPVGESRANAGHFFEHLYQRASRISDKPSSATIALVTDGDNVVVMDNSSIDTIAKHRDYTGVKLQPNSDNLQIVQEMLINDPNAKLISTSRVDKFTTVDTYELSNGKKLTIRIKTGKNQVVIRTSDKRVIKIKKPPTLDIWEAKRNEVGLKRLFGGSKDIKAYVDRLKARGLRDSEIVEEAIVQLEKIGAKDFARQARMLQRAGAIASPLMFAMVLYSIHMINTAPPSERAEKFTEFIGGFGGFAAGAWVGYKYAPPNLLAKAGAAFVIGTLFAVGGDAATSWLIDFIGLKPVLESKNAQAAMIVLSFFDPITVVSEEMKIRRIVAERRNKNEYIVRNGVEGWNLWVDGETRHLRMQLDVLISRDKNPVEGLARDRGIKMPGVKVSSAGKAAGPQLVPAGTSSMTTFGASVSLSEGEQYAQDLLNYSATVKRDIGNICAEIERLNATKVDVRRETFNNEADYHRFLESLRRKANAELHGEVIVATEG